MGNVIETKDLGLAAYIKVKGFKLLGCDNRIFKFQIPEGVSTSKSEIEVEYANSCCRQHDANVMCLRQLLTP